MGEPSASSHMASTKWDNRNDLAGAAEEMGQILVENSKIIYKIDEHTIHELGPHRAEPGELDHLPIILREKVPREGQKPKPAVNFRLWEEGHSLMTGQQFCMRTPTTNKIIVVCVADSTTRLLHSLEEDYKYYDCQAFALGTWIPANTKKDESINEGWPTAGKGDKLNPSTRQGYRIRLECLWDVLHDSDLADVIYEEQQDSPKPIEIYFQKDDVIVLWKPDLRKDGGRDGAHAMKIHAKEGASIAIDIDAEGVWESKTNVESKNGATREMGLDGKLTIKDVRNKQRNYFETEKVPNLFGIYRLIQPTSFN